MTTFQITKNIPKQEFRSCEQNMLIDLLFAEFVRSVELTKIMDH